MRDYGSKVVFGKVQRRAKPAKTVRPPTEGGVGSRLDLVTTTTRTTGATHTVTMPTYASSDLVLMAITYQGRTGGPATPTGWTRAAFDDTADHGDSAVFYRVMDGTEGVTVDIASGGTATSTVAWTHRGIDFSTYTPDVSVVVALNPAAVSFSHGSTIPYDVYVSIHDANKWGMTVTDDDGYTVIADTDIGSVSEPVVLLYHKKIASGVSSEDPNITMTSSFSIPSACFTIAVAAVDPSGGSVATGDHTHLEADVTDLGHWVEADHDALDHTGLTGVGGATAVNDLTDATITTPADNEILAYDNGTAEWINQTAAEAGLSATGHGHTTALDDLSDVTITTPSTGQVVKYNGTAWINDTDDTGSGSLPTATTKGDLAVYNGTSWVRVGTGANDTVLTADSAESAGVKWASGGGGSSAKSYITEPPMAPPGTAHADDEEFEEANATDPTTLGLSWSNQDSCTAEIRGGRCYIDMTTSTARDIHMLVKAFPASGDVTLSARVSKTTENNSHSMGIVFMWGTLASPTQIEHLRYISDDIFWTRPGVSNRQNLDLLTKDARPYLQFRWDDTAGTVRAFYAVSPMADSHWRPLGAATNVSSGVAPDYYGIGAGDEVSASTVSKGFADFMRVNWTPDFDASTDV